MTSVLKVDNIQNSSGTDAISIDSSGNVGIGTTSPATFGANTNGLTLNGTASGQNITLQQSGSNKAFIYNNTNDVYFVAEQTGSNLILGTGGAEKMRIDGSGKVLIGRNSSFAGGLLQVKNESGASLSSWDESNSGTRTHIEFLDSTSGSARGSITTNGSSTSYNTTSDHRLKENAVDMTGAIARVKNLQPKRFNFIEDDTNTIVDGFMAHEAQTVVPESVSGTHNEVDADGNAVYQSIDQSKLVPLLTGALQEAIAKIEALEARVQALENA